jgi:putative transposase
MSAPARRAKVQRTGAELSVRRQCALLNVALSGVLSPATRDLRRGSDSDAADRRALSGETVLRLAQNDVRPQRGTARGHRKRVQRLMRLMGLEGLVPRPGTSKTAPGNKIYPYLLRGVSITEANHVWASDITYIPMASGFLYLVAVIDWASCGCAPTLLFGPTTRVA